MVLRIHFYLIFIFVLQSACRADRPNIVLILADDLGYETVQCYGGESYETPNLNRLAQDGLRFDRAYAMPLCTNTRIQLMTGIYNLRNWRSFGILAPDARTFAHLLKDAGYATCMAGKWQLTSYDPTDYPGANKRRNTGMKIADAGFDEYSLWHTGHTETKGSRYADPVIEENGELRTDTQGKYGPDLWTDFIGQFMKSHRDRPFFVYYSMALPHNPMNPTPDSPEWRDPNMRHQDITKFAKDMTEYTDKMVGKVRKQIEDLGLAENTLLLFVSDNGTNMRVRSKFRGTEVGGEKGKASELGCRVPMLAYWPGKIRGGRESQALIDSVDFLPTLLDVAEITTPFRERLDGVSFAPILFDEKERTRDFVLIHQDPRPGWDKDRFWLDRVAIGNTHKLYEDGRLVKLDQDLSEAKVNWPKQDVKEDRLARSALESVLEQFSDFEVFNPNEVPRPDPNDKFARHRFQTQDAGNFAIIEAEQLPVKRDESWRIERNAPDYTGSGYLRCIRNNDEAHREPAQEFPGSVNVALSVENSGIFQVAIRMRLDTTTEKNGALRFKHKNASEWQKIRIDTSDAGDWKWYHVGEFRLQERSNDFQIAPGTRNIKIDRIAVFRATAEDKALDIETRCSEYHPWSKQ